MYKQNHFWQEKFEYFQNYTQIYKLINNPIIDFAKNKRHNF